MKYLILLTLSTLAVTAVYQIHLTKFESPMMKMMKAGTWNDYVMKKDVIRSIAQNHHKKYTQDVTDYDGVEYSAKITIGTPGQAFRVSLDTRGSILWVPDSTCEEQVTPNCAQCLQYGPRCQFFCGDPARNKFSNNASTKDVRSVIQTYLGCYDKKKFDQTKSSTYSPNGEEFQAFFGNPSNPWFARGFLGVDTVTFVGREPESLTVPKVTFGQATFINSQFANFSVDGILGLTFPDDDEANSPFIEAVNQGLVNKPIFTIFLGHNDKRGGEYGGLFTYGGLDDVNCGDIIAYEPLVSASYYDFKLEAVKFQTDSFEKGWDAILDSGTPLIWGSKVFVEKVAQVAKAHYDSSYRCYLVDCNAKLGDIQFTIKTKIYKVGPKEYIRKVKSGKCCLALDYQYGSGLRPEWLLGYPFLRSYCTIYDVKEKRIGFALPKRK